MATPDHNKLLLAADWCEDYEDDPDLKDVSVYLREKALGRIYSDLSKKYDKPVPTIRKLVSKAAGNINASELSVAIRYLENHDV